MKLENQVCSLELAEKLKELGVKQESLFYWEHKGWDEKEPIHKLLPEWEINLKDFQPFRFSAFTVAELGEMLPEWVTIEGKKYHGQTNRSGKDFYCSYGEYGKGAYLMNHLEVANTEANARTKMLIYLLENKLI